jgi:hypothetical protein
MKDFNYDKFLRDLKLLKELKEYAIKLNYDTILDEVISYLESIDIYLKNGMIPNIQTIIYKKNKIQNEES